MLAAPPDVIGAGESASRCDCDNGVELTGRMDQINRVAAGEVEIVDYKTGKPKIGKRTRDKDVQLSIYALAAREVLDSIRCG